MKEKVKELRVKIDSLSKLVKEMIPQVYTVGHGSQKVIDYNSKELTKTYDDLILAKAWLGKVFFVLTKEPISEDVNKATNRIDCIVKIDEEKVKWLILELNGILSNLQSIEGYVDSSVNTEPGCKLERYTNQAEYHLIEAAFWLELELQHINNK